MRWVRGGRGEVLYCVYYTLNVYYHTCHASFRNASFRNAFFRIHVHVVHVSKASKNKNTNCGINSNCQNVKK